jgi:TonB family protein
LFEARGSDPTCATRPICAVLSLLILLSASTPSVWAQNTPSVRKVVYKVAPKYPDVLKQNDIGGIVRLSISINPNGSVGKVIPIGGNPILVDAAILAVKQWKYVATARPTNAEVQLDFIPRQ